MNKKISCIKCRSEISANNIGLHYNSKSCKQGYTFYSRPKTTTSLVCEFCNRVSKNLNSSAQHLIRCKNNPTHLDMSYSGANLQQYNDRVRNGDIKTTPTNQYIKAKETGVSYIITTETRKKMSESSIKVNKERWASEENRNRQSVSMKKAVLNNPDSYSSGNVRGRVKIIEYNGIKFQGSWELDFYKWCMSNSIKCSKNTTIGFQYEWNGVRTYYPDFYLEDYNLWVEVKGYETARDQAKWSNFPNKLLVIKKHDIMSIRKNTYSLPCENGEIGETQET